MLCSDETCQDAAAVPRGPCPGGPSLVPSAALALDSQYFFGSTPQWEAGHTSPLKPQGTLTSPVLGDPERVCPLPIINKETRKQSSPPVWGHLSGAAGQHISLFHV